MEISFPRSSNAFFAALLFALPFAVAAQADANVARNLAANCSNCHGLSANIPAGMPAIAGRPKDELLAALREFRDGRRPATVMQQLSKGYSDAQLDMIAAYFAARK